MKTQWICIGISLLGIAACTPSPAVMTTASAQTQVAQPTATLTLTETATPSPTPSETHPPSPAPDTRVIDIDPQELLLEKNDLPPEGEYFLPGPDWTSPVTNSEIVSEWTVREGQDYLAETGRIHGWEISYKRGGSGALMPDEIYHNTVIYSSIEGARIVVTKYQDRVLEIGEYSEEINVIQIGDATRAFIQRDTTPGGEKSVSLRVAFSYRNIFHTIVIWGSDREASVDFAVGIATALLEQLQALPLTNVVTFKP